MTAFPAPDDSSAGIPLADRGNPAGVVLDAASLDDAEMLSIAADLGYSETAFVTGGIDGRYAVRYFTPTFEIPFCGHATVATAVALAEAHGPGRVVLDTPVGPIELDTVDDDGLRATFTSVEPRVSELPDGALDELLDIIGVAADDLDPRYPPRLAFAGNEHPVIALRDRSLYDGLRFDSVRLRRLMDAHGWVATAVVLHALTDSEFDARNLFGVGDIAEDPATGSAAAAVGGWLRELALVPVPGDVVIHQGSHVGRPSLIRVRIPATGGIAVTGSAIAI